MALPQNTLQRVQTYQESALAYLLNLCCFVSTSNTKFKDFERLEANLGDTVTFDLPPRYVFAASLIATFQASQQRVQSLTCDQSGNVSYAFSNQQFIFNVREYLEKFGKSAVAEFATQVEANIAANATSAVISQDTGLPFSNSGPFRFFGDGVTPINSYGQLAQMLANFRNFGSAMDSTKVYLPDVAVPAIVNTGLNQFATTRNNEIANSWWLGDFAHAEFYQSNLLPIHISGTVGNASGTSNQLTVISTNDPTGANITQITFSGATASDANAIFYADRLQGVDNVSGQPNLRFLTFIGHQVSAQPVQIRTTAGAAADGSGHVTVNIFPALSVTPGPNQNINNNIVAGMKFQVYPSHRAGLVVGGNALFLAMPRLPEEVPFPTANKTDPDTAVSMRMYYGSLFGQNERGFVHDAIWGSTLVPEYSMALLFPL